MTDEPHTSAPEGHLPAPLSPTVWQRWLASELARLRSLVGLSQKAAAAAVGKSHATVSNVETARARVGLDDLEKYLDAYGVPDLARPQYRKAAERAYEPDWWERFDRNEFPRWFSLYLGLEQGARTVQTYQSTFVHGLLQAPDYARAQLRSNASPRTDPHIERLVKLRMGRHEVLTRYPDPLELSVVLNESVLRQIVGDAQTMAVQLAHLVDMTSEPNVDVRVLPFTEGGAAPETSFSFIGFPWADDPGVVYIETPKNAFYIDDRGDTNDYLLTFNYLCTRALSPERSVELIRQVASEMMQHE